MVSSTCSSKGQHSPHEATTGRKPVAQIYYAVMSTMEQPGSVVTICAGIDVRTQMAMAVVAPLNSVNRYGIGELKRFIDETGRTQAIIQCDEENSINAVKTAAIELIGGLTGRLAPTGSSQSQGSVRGGLRLYSIKREHFN